MSPSPRDSQAWHGFAAGSASGITKCLVGHPFDTIKVRLQTATTARFAGPLDCFTQTMRNEGFKGFYKGVTPPLVGWLAMDSVYDRFPFLFLPVPSFHDTHC